MDVFGWQTSLRANDANDRPKMPKSLGFLRVGTANIHFRRQFWTL